jgi:hypothetical protein
MAQNLADNLYAEWSQTLGDVGKEAREGSPMAGVSACGAALVMHSISVAYSVAYTSMFRCGFECESVLMVRLSKPTEVV